MNRKQLISLLICLLISLLLQAADLKNETKLQRGAKFFINYCSGCHSLRYLRYNRLNNELGLTTHKESDPLQSSMPPEEARQWFGIVPPDLSLIARERSTSWINSYLKGFFADSNRPFGANNKLVPYTAMPNVLYPLSGQESQNKDLDDLLAFLVYVAEPAQLIRYRLGWIVLFFLAVFCLVAYQLKKIYWKRLSSW